MSSNKNAAEESMVTLISIQGHWVTVLSLVLLRDIYTAWQLPRSENGFNAQPANRIYYCRTLIAILEEDTLGGQILLIALIPNSPLMYRDYGLRLN